ncbi:MAG TPA: AAA family ATPase [Candidatus Omnitrophota bacterium]|nr:AAA family ATPase [Candidatus Omnitrophota bacterium]HQO59135.1 AAA family ATPase [Candidatus Omnitrophota bacterium]
MKLKKFRITHYKSIVDSGYCCLSSDLTIFLGKNESGKTAILEALRDFDRQSTSIPGDAFPVSGNGDEPKLEMVFSMSEEELRAIQETTGIKLEGKISDHVLENGVALKKDCRGSYDLKDEKLAGLLEAVNQGQRYFIRCEEKKLIELLKGYSVPDLNLEAPVPVIQDRVQQLFVTIKSLLPLLKDENLQQAVIESLRFIKQESKNLPEKEPERDVMSLFLNTVVERLPHFILFNEFNGMLPFEIALTDIKSNQAVMDFAKIARLDIDKVIATEDTQKRLNILNRHSACISGDFLNYWGQNKMELVIWPEGDKLLFGVKESGKTEIFKVEQRSKGFQWFLSFYLRLNSQRGRNNIILIDEPGMNLHAKAQLEIIKVLESMSTEDNQIIFSTHSPYLIDALRLDRLRLVVKDAQKGSIIESSLNVNADNETLMPLMSVLNMNLNQNLFGIDDGRTHILVDGLANYYFLEGLRICIKDIPWGHYHFIPSADRIHIRQVASYMVGCDMPFKVVLEHDAEGQDLAVLLKDTFGLENSRVIFIGPVLGERFEDLFSREDFFKYFLGEPFEDMPPGSNSNFSKNKNRVWLAKKFSERAMNQQDVLTLSDKTHTSFHDFSRQLLGELPEEAPGTGRKKKSLLSEIRRFPFFPFPKRNHEMTERIRP